MTAVLLVTTSWTFMYENSSLLVNCDSHAIMNACWAANALAGDEGQSPALCRAILTSRINGTIVSITRHAPIAHQNVGFY